MLGRLGIHVYKIEWILVRYFTPQAKNRVTVLPAPAEPTKRAEETETFVPLEMEDFSHKLQKARTVKT